MNEITKELLDALKYAASCLGTDGNDPIDVVIAKAEAALNAQQSDEDWVPWAGGENPVWGDTLVQVRLKCGDIVEDNKAGFYYWDNVGCDGDIVAYRVVQK